MCVVAETADRSPLLRIKAAKRATALAEYFRDKGQNVLLIMDSLTRAAHAQREIGLALGETSTSRGYPTSALAIIPKLAERAGNIDENGGSITGIYTVLADGDDENDPIVDASRAILDGHILLSREFSQMGVYPAINISTSISRVMSNLISEEHDQMATDLRKLFSLYQENKDLLLMGGYSKGQDNELDRAIDLWDSIKLYISQKEDHNINYEHSISDLKKLLGG